MRKDIPIQERLIFALDVPTVEEAMGWVDRLDPQIRFFKVGLQLFLAGGFDVVSRITERGHKVMLDLKFYDVPQTVKLAVRQLQGRGVAFATVHGNRPIVEAAAEAKGDVKILAVTVLTSFGEEDIRELGSSRTVEELVLLRAEQARAAGCDGVVASGQEAPRLRTALGEDFFIVTPGIRPAAAAGQTDDQKRIVTAEEAVRNGADHIVVGRPISRASDPVAVAVQLQKEIEAGLARA